MEAFEITAPAAGQSPALAEKPASPASLVLSPAFQGLTTIINCVPAEEVDADPGQVLGELQSIVNAVNAGDMKHPEALAISQATALNVMFAKLSSVAMGNMQSPYFDSLMRLALRAQSQCSRTLHTLKTLKNPGIFADQVNVAHQQIVNNAPLSPEAPHSALSSATPT